jgi:hypothetical protein
LIDDSPKSKKKADGKQLWMQLNEKRFQLNVYIFFLDEGAGRGRGRGMARGRGGRGARGRGGR